MPRVVQRLVEALEVTRVGERVQRDDVRLGPLVKQEPHQVRADEARTSGDQAPHGGPPPVRTGLSRPPATRRAARWSDVTVPASVHQPLRTRCLISPHAM